MVEIVVSVAAKVSEYLVDPVVRQLGYLFNYRTNIEDLSQQVEKLRDVWDRQQHSVDEAKRNGHEIFDDVPKWLTHADGFMQDASKFLEDEKAAPKSCFNGLMCPNLKSRYQLSREARKKAGVAAQIHRDGLQIKSISYRPPLQEIRSAPSEALRSRLVALNQVMEALREANINRIGIWGLGGVGKSTLVKQVAEQAAQEKLFDKVVTASVLQNPDYRRIQGELADKLDMKLEEESEEGRAARLHQRMKKEKTILVVLDDLWAEVDLEKIGVPYPAADHHKGCKLLLTSRDKHVLSNEMGTQKDFRVEHLEEDEAWVLFKNKAHDTIESLDLQPIAMEVAKECAGLPIAIVTVATALKNKSLPAWRDALQQLKRPTPTNIRGMDAKVYSSLELSYKHLQGDEVKSFFLLCAIISTNDISIEDLFYYGMGLGLFRGTNTLEEAKNRIDTLVDNLKASNLLLETGHFRFVRIHDVVRNVAVIIASRERHVFALQRTTLRKEDWPSMDELKKITWVSLDQFDCDELPEGLVCPKLELFGCYPTRNSSMKVPHSFFEGMKQLKVLDFTNMHLPWLPSSLRCLENLRTLCLDGCISRDISAIAELKKLEILTLRYSAIEELPREIAELTHLRLFDLWGSSQLKVIPPYLISSLARIETLRMGNSFTQWDQMEGKSNACLAELNQLTLLTSLEIHIPDAKLLPEDRVFDKLVRFKIFIGDVWLWKESYKIDRILKLSKFDTSILHVVDGMSKLLKRSEDLHLCKLCGGTDAISKLDGEGFPKLKHLNVESSPDMEYIVKSTDLTPSCCAFPVMETLSLNQLIKLQEVISHGQFSTGSFGCLRKVEVEDCDGLTFLFSLVVGRSLSKLEEIRVSRCKNMVEMVSRGWEEIKEDGIINVPILFPELRHLTLQELPKLKNILCLFEEEKSVLLSNQLEEMRRDSQLLLSLGRNLRFLKLVKCMSLVKLFPPSLLQNLEVLIVENCDNLEQLFDTKGLNVDDGHVRLLPELRNLDLNGLPNLRHICNWGSSTNDHFPSASLGNIIFPKLNKMSLKSLPILTSFSPGYHSFQRLQHANLDTPFPVLFVETVAFPHLEYLHIHGVDNVKKIWDDQLPQDSFSKLKDVWVESCGGLLNIFPSYMLKRSQSLHTLIVRDCISLKEVFEVEGLDVNVNANVKEEGVTVVPLSELILHLLPKVEKIWTKDPHGILTFQNLKSIYIHECESLKNLFPACLVRDLVELQELRVFSCERIEEIIAKDINGVLLETTPTFVFPKLTSLQLYKLPELTSLYIGVHTSQWPLLENLKVFQCHKLNVFAFETPTFEQRHHKGNLHVPLFSIEHVAFPYLKELLLGHNNDTEIWQEQFSANSFPRLTVLDVRGYENISIVIPSLMLQALHNVEELHVRDCSSVKEVFQLEGLDEEHQPKSLRQLRVLQLWHLPGLTHLWKENNKPSTDLQSLESLQVWNHDSLINLVPSSVASFQNLSILDVRSCGSLRSLISPSVAKTLVELQKLIAWGSYMMEEIVANEGEEVVDEITFRKLQHMELVDLPNLTSFSSGGYKFSFPSLEHMGVKGCPKMEIFSPSLITAPKLKIIKLEDDEWHWQDDLNTTIQRIFRKTHGETIFIEGIPRTTLL